MPYRMKVRLATGACLILVALFFSSTASLQQRSDSLLPRPAPAASTRPTKDNDLVSDDQVVVNTDLISFNVTVTDKSGQHISGLPRTAFTVFDEKKAQEISFFGEDDSPISVGIVFDLTGSMTEGKARRAREAIARFMETSHQDDEYYLITLRDGESFLSLDRTRDHRALLDKLTQVDGRGKTALYDACYLGLNKVMLGTRPRRALLVISDGQDNNSRYSLDDVEGVVKESDVIIYTIGVGEKGNDDRTLYGEQILRDMASISGGKFFQPGSAKEMYEVFERIALELRRQYAIGYKPSNFTADGKWRHIKVKIEPPPGSPRLFIRYRNGYYAPASPR